MGRQKQRQLYSVSTGERRGAEEQNNGDKQQNFISLPREDLRGIAGHFTILSLDLFTDGNVCQGTLEK